MKKINFGIILLLLMLFNVDVWAHEKYDVRIDGNSYSYVDTLKVSPDIAYSNAQNWIVISSKSYKGSVQYEDKDQKKIIAKSGTVYPFDEASNVESFLIFDLTTELKDGKFRVKLENIKYFSLIHSVDFGLGPTGEDTSEINILDFSGYEIDKETAVAKFKYDKEYADNKLKLQELLDKKNTTKKKKELEELNTEINRINNKQESIENIRENYTRVNKLINEYVEILAKQLNTDDDF